MSESRNNPERDGMIIEKENMCNTTDINPTLKRGESFDGEDSPPMLKHGVDRPEEDE